jgi:hypothetical protein
MRLTHKEVEQIAGVRPRSPKPGEIWRGWNAWERHVTFVSKSDIAYIQVVHGRKNVERNCLPGTWDRWVLAASAKYVGDHR